MLRTVRKRMLMRFRKYIPAPVLRGLRPHTPIHGCLGSDSGSVVSVKLISYKLVLRGKAGVPQKAGCCFPMLQPPVIIPFQFIGDNKRHDPVMQAFFEKDEPSDPLSAIKFRIHDKN